MAKTKDQKKAAVEAYSKKLQGSTGVLLVQHSGLEANAVSEFKKQLAATGASFNVITNTLFKLALEAEDLPELETLDFGPHAALFASEDIAAAAKALDAFIKENKDHVEIKAGIMEGKKLTEAQVKQLAEMPTMEESIAMIAGILTQSISGVANVMQQTVQSLVIILDQAFTEE